MTKQLLSLFAMISLATFSLSAQKIITPANVTAEEFSHSLINFSLTGISDTLRSKGLFLYGYKGGYNLKSLRFDRKYDFELLEEGQLQLLESNNPAYEYPSKVFRSGFSALSGHYIRLAPVVGFGKKRLVYVITGPTIDFRIGSTQQHRYYVGKTLNQDFMRGNEALQLKTFNAGWRVGLGAFGVVSINYEWAFTNFLRDDEWNTNVKFNGISVIIGV
ncbi:MAG: hypothetical protein AAGG68_04635 [Bacteroidota bacterium]